MESVSLSIIIPAYNSAKTIKNTLDSIVRQRFNGLECWIIDGRSSDDTARIAEKYCAEYSFIHLLSEPDKGIYDAMNKGIALSKGSHLYFMGSDDVFFNDTVLNTIFSDPSISKNDLIYGDVVFRHSRIRHGAEKTYLGLIKNLDNVNHQAIFYSRKVFDTVGSYDLNYPIYADFNLNIKCFRNAAIKKKYVPVPICLFNEKGTSFSQRQRDNYIQQVHEKYVVEHEDPVAMYDTIKYMEEQASKILSSKEYIAGKKIGNMVRKIRRLSKLKLWMF